MRYFMTLRREHLVNEIQLLRQDQGLPPCPKMEKARRLESGVTKAQLVSVAEELLPNESA